MRIDKIKLLGEELYVIFTGSHYYLFSNHYGTIGMATREGDIDDLGFKKFTIVASTEYTVGSRLTKYVISEKMKSIITEMENKYVQCNIDFKVSDEKLKYINLLIRNKVINN